MKVNAKVTEKSNGVFIDSIEIEITSDLIELFVKGQTMLRRSDYDFISNANFNQYLDIKQFNENIEELPYGDFSYFRYDYVTFSVTQSEVYMIVNNKWETSEYFKVLIGGEFNNNMI